MRTITALFDAPVPARAAARALVTAGFSPTDITLVPPLPGAQPFDFSQLPVAGEDPRDLVNVLGDLGVPEAEALFYAEGVRRGAILLVVTAPTLSAPVAADVIAGALPPDPNALAAAWAADPGLRYTWADIPPPVWAVVRP